MSLRVAAFVSAHGWGHAARTAAVLAALRERRPGTRLHLFTRAPRWFLEETLGDDVRVHPVEADVGLVQRDALREDPRATVSALDGFFSRLPALAERTARRLESIGADLLVADIAPLGIAAGRRAALPVALVENFTWDWIYRAYFDVAPGLRGHAERLRALYATVDLHVQVEPVCSPAEGAARTGPVARPLRDPPAVRARLGLTSERPLVVVSMGGVDHELPFASRIVEAPGVHFVLLGGDRAASADVTRLSGRERPYHPDLMAAADAVVGKLGYSTVAEALQGGTRFAWVERPAFPETAILGDYVERRLPALAVGQEAFAAGDWIAGIPALLERPASPRRTDGAAAAAAALLSLVDGPSSPAATSPPPQ